MAEKKSTSKKAAKTAVSAPELSDKQKVIKHCKSAELIDLKKGFAIFSDKKDGIPLHSGLAKSESDAWKLAAHAVS